MPPVAVVTDSTTYIPKDILSNLPITVSPQVLIWGDKTSRDGVDIQPEEFYTQLKKATVMPTTLLQLKKIFLIGFCVIFFILAPFSSALNTNQFNLVSFNQYDYHTYQELTDELHSLQANNSNIMSLTSIGKTYEGRDLWMVKLSDNVDQEEDEPGVLFMGAHHGNEWPGIEICLFFIQYMVDQYDNNSIPEIQDVINTTQIFLIPMVNPDGVMADTRKNCVPNHGPFGYNPSVTSYGVNLNRNYNDPWFLAYLFPARFYLPFILSDSSFNYRGPYPFSENETKAVNCTACRCTFPRTSPRSSR